MHQKGSFRIEGELSIIDDSEVVLDDPIRTYVGDARVQKSYRELSLNPYIVLASALPMLVSVYMPLPDQEILHIEEECLQIRNNWNGLVPSGMSECKVKVHLRDMSWIPPARE